MAKVRVTQTWLEVVTQDDTQDLRVSQALLETLGQFSDKLRVSQAALEAVGRVSDSSLHVTQAALEVLGYQVGPDVPLVTVSGILATTADLTGSAFVQGTGTSAVHSASRWLVFDPATGLNIYDSGETATDLLTHTPPVGSLIGGLEQTAHVMYKNGAGEWSYYPGAPSTPFTTLTTDVSGGMAIEFWEGDDTAPTALISTYYTTVTTATAYGDWLRDEQIPVPLNTRYILPFVYSFGGGTGEMRIKQVQIDKGRISGGYHPAAVRPDVHDSSVIPASGVDVGAIPGLNFEIDWTEGDVATVELDHTSTMAWLNLEQYRDYFLIVEQGAGGGFLLTWPTEAKFAGGTPPTLTTTAGAKDVFKLIAESASIVHVHTLALDSK